MDNFILKLFDICILDNYEYVSKEQFVDFVKHNVFSALQRIDIDEFIPEVTDVELLPTIEKDLYYKMISCIKNVQMVRHTIPTQIQIDELIFGLINQKVFMNSIDNIILLEEIDFINRNNISNKLRYAYYYLLEYEIYDFFDIKKIDWLDETKKQHVINKVLYSSQTQEKIKQTIIKNINNDMENEYLHKKEIGILSTYPAREIKEEYDASIWLEIYKIKYLLTLDSKLKKCADNKVLINNNSTMKQDYKEFFEEVLDKCRKQDGVLHERINSLEDRISKLDQDIMKKEKIISDYTESVEEYNKLPFFKKLLRLIKKTDIKLLKKG